MLIGVAWTEPVVLTVTDAQMTGSPSIVQPVRPPPPDAYMPHAGIVAVLVEFALFQLEFPRLTNTSPIGAFAESDTGKPQRIKPASI
jgi:hypothetical protein